MLGQCLKLSESRLNMITGSLNHHHRPRFKHISEYINQVFFVFLSQGVSVRPSDLDFDSFSMKVKGQRCPALPYAPSDGMEFICS